MSVFKVWSGDRKHRIYVLCQCTLDTIIPNANLQLGINGNRLWLENDGTLIDTDEILKIFCNEIFILLEKNESWIPLSNTNKGETRRRNNFSDELQGNGQIIETEVNQEFPVNCIPLAEIEENEQIPGVEVNQEAAANNEVPGINPHPKEENHLNIWNNYQYDWSNLDRSYVQHLEAGSVDNVIKKEVVHKVIAHIKNVNKIIPCSAIRSVSKKNAEMYPDSFEDRKNGKTFGKGHTNLYQSLLNHSNYILGISKNKNQKKKKQTKNLRFYVQAKLGATN